MQMEEALKVGFLLIPPHNFLRKTWMKRYCALYEASNHGIQRMELFETEDAYVKRIPSIIIPLTDCWKVSPLPQKNQSNVFEVTTKSNSYQFSAEAFQEMSDWIVSLQKVAFSKFQVKPQVPSLPTNEEKQEENLLYCSVDERNKSHHLVRQTMDDHSSRDCVKLKLNEKEFTFVDGKWNGEFSGDDIASLLKQNQDLIEENNFLKLKIEILLNMVAEDLSKSETSDLSKSETSDLSKSETSDVSRHICPCL